MHDTTSKYMQSMPSPIRRIGIIYHNASNK
jgi:hypothetical protein